MTGDSSWFAPENDGDTAVEKIRNFMTNTARVRYEWMNSYHALMDLYERALWIYGGSFGLSFPEDAIPDHQAFSFGAQQARFPASSHNATKSVIDTLVARLFSEIPRLRVAIHGANYNVRLQAARQSRILNSRLDPKDKQAALMRWAKEGLLAGFAALWPKVLNTEFVLDRILLGQLWWHPDEARITTTAGSPPRSMHVEQVLGRGQIRAAISRMGHTPTKVARLQNAVDDLPVATQSLLSSDYYYPTIYERTLYQLQMSQSCDLLYWLWSFHLPSSPGADDGRLIINVSNNPFGRADAGQFVVLFDGPWKRTSYPFVWWSAYQAYQGLMGIGVGHTCIPFQQQIDDASMRLQEAISTFGDPKVLYAPGVQEEKQNIATPGINFVQAPPEVAEGLRSSGRPYEVITHAPQDPQLLGWMDSRVANLHHVTGVNQGIAQGMSQLGANASGKALNVEDTRSNDRFNDILLLFDAAYTQLGQEILNAHDDAMQTDPAFRVWVRDRFGGTEYEPWAKLRVDTGAYSVLIEEVGGLGRTAAARIRAIEELGKLAPMPAASIIRAIYGDHDLESQVDLGLSAINYIEWKLYYLVITGEENTEKARRELARYWPDPETDLEIAIPLVTAEIQKARRERADDHTIDLLIEWKSQAQALRKQQAAAIAPPPDPMMAAAGGAPGGMPGAPPAGMPDIGGAPPIDGAPMPMPMAMPGVGG